MKRRLLSGDGLPDSFRPEGARVIARIGRVQDVKKRLLAGIAVFALAACGETALAPFGNLDTPVSVAVHEPTGQLFIALQGTNDLRVLDTRAGDFLVAPAELFPLSIPTVRTPIAVAAATRFAFVVSGATAEVGFVDTQVPAGAFGPRSVDGPDGFPITIAIDAVPTAALAFTADHGFADDGALADHLIVAGLSPDGDGGSLTIVRPPHLPATGTEPLPSVAAELLLPGAFPAGLAIDKGPVNPAGVVDCRTVAVADSALEPGHVPGVIFTRVRVAPDGSITVDAPAAADRVELRIPVTLPDGSVEVRTAGARAVAFGPAPEVPGLDAAVAADPCAIRSGRLFVLLEPSYCGGARSCPNLAVLDLGGTPTLATDATSGGPAAYTLPGAQLGLVAMQGPFTLSGAFDPSRIGADNDAAKIENLPELTLVTSSDGALSYVAGGLGTFLQADGSRAAPDPVFLISSSSKGPQTGSPRRTDTRLRVAEVPSPTVELPPGAAPRSETWTAGFEIPLPGLSSVGNLGLLQGGDTLSLPVSSPVTFVAPVPVLASADPLLADRLVPVAPAGVVCDGFPIASISADGRTLQVDRNAPDFDNPAGCDQAELPLAILPPKSLPWTLAGSVTGFVGRAPAASTVNVFAGDTLLFRFVTPLGDIPRGATWAWDTSRGFSLHRATPQSMGLMPASVAAVLQSGIPGINPTWRVYVAYSGIDAVMRLNPAAPGFGSLTFFQ